VLEWMAGKERLGRGGTRARRNLGLRGHSAGIDSEGGGANGFWVYGRKGETERI